MKGHRTSEGLGLILIIIIIVALVLVSGLLFAAFFRARSTTLVLDAFWMVDNQRVSTIKLGQIVEAHLVIKATEEYVGSIVVKIRKDVAHSLDTDFQISTIPINLKGGEEKEIEIGFTPDEASGSSFFGLRGYFIEIEFQATRTTWAMENSYPPRLKVTD